MHTSITVSGKSTFEEALAAANTLSLKEVSDWLKAAVDDQARAAGLGNKLGKATRRTVYPQNRNSADAALFFEARRNTIAVKLFDVFNNGAVIRSKHGFWLAIPTPAAAQGRYAGRNGGTQRVNPGAWERATGIKLRFVYRRGKPSLLVADNIRINTRGKAVAQGGVSGKAGPNVRLHGRASAVIFILVPQVTLKKRLDWKALGAKALELHKTHLKANLYAK
jgi:hypothetical protein